MSLATRLSAFFLVALAIVLSGFAGSLYFLAKTYLNKQNDERLELALDTLAASVDIEPGGLEWEPMDRRMTVGADPAIDAIRWAVRDGRGVLVDRSANSQSSTFPLDWSPREWPRSRPLDATVFDARTGWRLAARRLQLQELLRQGRGHPDDEPGFEVQYPTLELVVGSSPAPMEATLNRLGLTLIALSSVLWISAATVGRWLCHRALAPVHRMAKAATAMTAADLGQQLPSPGTGDELDELGRAFNDLLERLNEAFARLRTAYEQQKQFAANASHQLRTPLTALLGQVQVVRRRDRSPEEYRRVLNLVYAEGGRLRQIIESLLFLADPDGSRPKSQAVELAEWVPNFLGQWTQNPRSSDVHCEIKAEPPIVVEAYLPLLAQLLDNLLDNACKYSRAGTPITVRVSRDVKAAVLSVEDLGFGLSSDEVKRVFEPFYRSEEARRNGQSGVGLGLALAASIAETFGGALSVSSQLGVGSVFTLRLNEVSSLEPSAMDTNHRPIVESA
ncbi:ATP-binding protein [Singulisphaera sp. PoT]|uniref:ATP-binding protein n=1 Tax=Singulisphaera sp. PoT TaxID=3411797 RepID=UPI003BF608F0